DSATGVVYPSFCANAGSTHFAGESGLGCAGYLVASRLGKELADYAGYVSAYNYIEDKVGSLNDNRALTQTVTWALLGAIDVGSPEFEAIEDWKLDKAAVLDVMANYQGYVGSGKIVDLVFMVCEDHEHSYQTCQPQLVPVYGKAGFDNTAKVFGSLCFAAKVKAQHKRIMTQPVWQKTIQPIRQKTIQPYMVPVFEKKVSKASGTLVTRLTYSGNDAKAVPTNGGAFGNGHTYVNIPNDSVKRDFVIADSSMNSNGKKTPAEYNRPIEYTYSAQIVDGKLEITFDDRLISASVGGYVVGAASVPSQPGNGNGNNGNGNNGNGNNGNGNGNGKGNSGNGNGNGNQSPVVDIAALFPGNAPKHITVKNGGKLVLDLPEADDNGNYYLYLHLEGVNWYTTGQYEFVCWRPAPERSVEVSDCWVRNEVVCNQWVRDKVSERIICDGPYDDALIYVSVVGPDGESVYSGPMMKLDGLVPGEYTCTFSSAADDFEETTVTVTVKPGETALAIVGPIIATGEDENITLPKIYDKPIILSPTYLEPSVLDPIKLGIENDPLDPFGEGAIRLN
ncbi:MAG: hypothetical protein FWE94_08300, partial [Coriobacteriia bacterium]|nr:hypothetical protein [Coriobacteriia bacterium]